MFSYAPANATPLEISKTMGNLRFYSPMAPSFNEFMTKFELSRSTLFSSFSKLDIGGDWDNPCTNAYWPLVNLDLSVLQSLHIGYDVTRFNLSSLNAMFAKGCFGSLTGLKFTMIVFHETLRLTNMPSLKRLIFKFCEYPKHSPPLVLADGFKLPYFWFCTHAYVKEPVPFLTQIKGLEYLSIRCLQSVLQTDHGQAGLARAIALHKETLRTLDLREQLQYESSIDATLWENDVVKVIERCQNLVRLSLPLAYDKPLSYYRYMAGRFPDLVSLTVYDLGLGTCSS